MVSTRVYKVSAIKTVLTRVVIAVDKLSKVVLTMVLTMQYTNGGRTVSHYTVFILTTLQVRFIYRNHQLCHPNLYCRKLHWWGA